MDFKFDRTRIDKIPREKIIGELEKVAEKYQYTRFTSKDFLRDASIGHQVVFREFGTWDEAMRVLTNHLKQKNLTLKQRTKPKRKDAYTQRQLFDEMQRIWSKIGHRPSKIEWEQADPEINYNTVRRHFNGWTNACLKFIEHITGETVVENKAISEKLDNQPKKKVKYEPENNRTIPLGIRLEVLARDNFRCVYCGKSPSTDIGTKLHIDHILPFSKGGKSILENLQALCLDCNLGKSDRPMKINTTQSVDLKKGGDGGQVFIITGNISGNGKITADGGDGEMGGNAGKIHIESKTNNYSGNISAKGGKSTK